MSKSKTDGVLRDLVIANRILARENVLDAFGHVSARHPERPDRFFLSRSRSPELVEREDVMEFTLDGEAVAGDARQPYHERFIHAAVYAARPEINAVVHSHADEVLPFSVVETPLRPLVHAAAKIGRHIPVWDIDERFGNATNMLVQNMDHGRDLAARLGSNSVVLMRGHGFSAAAPSLLEAVGISVYMPRNARMLADAMRLGTVKCLADGEIEAHSRSQPHQPGSQRQWEYWSKRAGFEYEPGGYVPD